MHMHIHIHRHIVATEDSGGTVSHSESDIFGYLQCGNQGGLNQSGNKVIVAGLFSKQYCNQFQVFLLLFWRGLRNEYGLWTLRDCSLTIEWLGQSKGRGFNLGKQYNQNQFIRNHKFIHCEK